MKLSVCIDAVFRSSDHASAIRKLASLGYDAIEFWGWWDKDLDELEDALGTHNVRVATFCTRFVSLVDRTRRSEYVDGLAESLTIAKRFRVDRLITQVGNAIPELSREAQRETLIEGLRACVPMLERSEVTLLVEPLNLLVDHAGYYLSRSDDAFGVVDSVGSERVKVLYDIYHQQITEGNLIPTIRHNVGRIGHFHAAGHPGRHELDTGEIRYDAVLGAIRKIGYDGFVGLEYFPSRDVSAGLLSARGIA